MDSNRRRSAARWAGGAAAHRPPRPASGPQPVHNRPAARVPYTDLMRHQAILTIPLTVTRQARQPLHEQIASQVGTAVEHGLLAHRTQLPSTRTLAALLGVSRGVTTAAYELLFTRGYLESQPGSGTYVAGRTAPGNGSGGPGRAGVPPDGARAACPSGPPRPARRPRPTARPCSTCDRGRWTSRHVRCRPGGRPGGGRASTGHRPSHCPPWACPSCAGPSPSTSQAAVGCRWPGGTW